MGYPDVQGYLWYALMGRIVEVRNEKSGVGIRVEMTNIPGEEGDALMHTLIICGIS